MSFPAQPPAALSRAVESPLVRGGLTLIAGVLTGNVIGFFRVAITAYFLGTHSRADALAVTIGPIDTVNSVLINSLVFAFVPMLTARQGPQRTALFQQLTRCFSIVSAVMAGAVVLGAPLADAGARSRPRPALLRNRGDDSSHPLALDARRRGGRDSVRAALYVAPIRADRVLPGRAQCLHDCVRAGALEVAGHLCVRDRLYGRSVDAARDRVVRRAFGPRQPRSRAIRRRLARTTRQTGIFRRLCGRPRSQHLFTRAYATHAGPGMAAALDYCMRGVGVPMAILVNPISNSLLPEIARLRSMANCATRCA